MFTLYNVRYCLDKDRFMFGGKVMKPGAQMP